jgi:hypothetical protein
MNSNFVQIMITVESRNLIKKTTFARMSTDKAIDLLFNYHLLTVNALKVNCTV